MIHTPPERTEMMEQEASGGNSNTVTTHRDVWFAHINEVRSESPGRKLDNIAQHLKFCPGSVLNSIEFDFDEGRVTKPGVL